MMQIRLNNFRQGQSKHLKLMLFFTLILVMSVLGKSSFAHDVTVNISGTILENTCSVSPDSLNRSVFLGNVASNSFRQTGDATMPTHFTINLEDCGAGTTGIQVTLTGNADKDNSDLLEISGDLSATGLGIALQDDEHNYIKINGTSKTYPIPSGSKDVTLSFYAQYMSTRSVITSGEANGAATFELAYP